MLYTDALRRAMLILLASVVKFGEPFPVKKVQLQPFPVKRKV